LDERINDNIHDAEEDAAEASANGHQQATPPPPPPTMPETASSAHDAQAAEYLAGWQRTRAEFANYKKRVERELSESHQRGALDALVKVLPMIDDFERAMQNVPADLEDHAWISGISMLLRKFEKLLNDFDVQPLDPVGDVFDPSRHEALGMDDSDTIASGHVTVTLQKGYISGDRVLRPALVRVAN
jgi:molecular chaperone GrpE